MPGWYIAKAQWDDARAEAALLRVRMPVKDTFVRISITNLA